MRIAVFATVFPALTESFVRREVRALLERGHEVAVFVSHSLSGTEAASSVPGVEVLRWIDAAAWRPSVIYAEMGFPAHRASIVEAHAIGIPFALRLWAGLDSFGLPAPCIPTYTGLADDPLCCAVIVEDEFMQKWAETQLKIGAELLHAIPNSLFLEEFAGPREPKPNTILAIGRLVPKKGFRYLIDAVLVLESHGIDVDLWLVGSGPEETALRTAAATAKGIEFLGALPEADLPALYAQAALYVAPSIEMESGDADGVPTTVLEAMASGCPVLASNLLSMPLYVRHEQTGFLAPPGDATYLAGEIASLLANSRGAARIGAAGRAWAREHLDIRLNIRRVEAVLAGEAASCNI